MATEADVTAADRHAAIVALEGEASVEQHLAYVEEGDTFFVGQRVRDVAVAMAEHRMTADAAGFARGFARLAQCALCEHPRRAAGPRIRLLRGTSETEICVDCGCWRMTLGSPGMWRPPSTLADETKDEDHDD